MENRLITIAFGLCFALALFLGVHAQTIGPAPGGGSGCPLSGCTYTGPVQIAAGSGTAPSLTNGGTNSGGWLVPLVQDGWAFTDGSNHQWFLIDNANEALGVGQFGCFNSTSTTNADTSNPNKDTWLCRSSAGVWELGTAQSNALGSLQLSSVIMAGSPPALTGTCTSGTQTGGNTAGTFLATCVAQTVILTFALTAPTGWVCNAHDLSTPTDVLNQTGTTSTTATLTGTTVASDKVAFNCTAY
jgi:hypothetical protein